MASGRSCLFNLLDLISLIKLLNSFSMMLWNESVASCSPVSKSSRSFSSTFSPSSTFWSVGFDWFLVSIDISVSNSPDKSRSLVRPGEVNVRSMFEFRSRLWPEALLSMFGWVNQRSEPPQDSLNSGTLRRMQGIASRLCSVELSMGPPVSPIHHRGKRHLLPSRNQTTTFNTIIETSRTSGKVQQQT